MKDLRYPNRLRDISKIVKLINRNDVIIMDDRDGTVYDKNKISHFVIIYDSKEDGYPSKEIRMPKTKKKEDDDDGYEETYDYKNDDKSNNSVKTINEVICKELKIINRFTNVDQHSWYIIPIYEYQTEFRPIFIDKVNLYSEDEIYLMVEDEPLFTVNTSLFRDDNKKEWEHTTYYILNEYLRNNNPRFYVKSIFYHNRNTHNINALAMALKSYNNAKSIRIKISNSIRSNFYVSIGRKAYNNLRQEVAKERNEAAEAAGKALKTPITPEDVNVFECIEEEYDKLDLILKRRVLTDDIRLITNRVLNTKKKSEREGSDFIDDMTKYLLKMIDKKSSISIDNENEFEVIKKDLGLRFLINLAIYHQIKEYKKYLEIEAASESYMIQLVHKHPYWNRYLVGLCGTGEIIAAELIVGFNPLMARHPSSYHRYVGMDQVIRRPDEKRQITRDLQIWCCVNMIENFFITNRNARAEGETINPFNFDRYKGNFFCYEDYLMAKSMVGMFRYEKEHVRKKELLGFLRDEGDFDQIIKNEKWVITIGSILEKANFHIDDQTQDVVIEKRARNKTDMVRSTYIDKNGEIKVKVGYGYNAKLKGKIVGVWAANILRKGGMDPKTGEYRSIYAKRYYESKARYASMPRFVHQLEMSKIKGSGVKKPNFHVMARRVMVQQFLEDLWFAERYIDGLPINGGTYAEDKLGICHLQERPSIISVPCYTKDDYDAYCKGK